MKSENKGMAKEEKIQEIDSLIKVEIQKGCKACNSLGLWHCAFPDECGNWDECIRLEKEKKQLLSV